MTITEYHDTGERVKDELTMFIRLINEFATKLEEANVCPTTWCKQLREHSEDFNKLREHVEEWKLKGMTDELVRAMANGQLSEQEMLALDEKAQRTQV